MTSDFIYKNNRSKLTIEFNGGGSLGNCYTSSVYKITSLLRLSQATLQKLHDINMFGGGQEFIIKSQCDGKEVPAGFDHAPCVEYDRRTGEVINTNPINKYSGKPYGSIEIPYFVYDVEVRCDSGD